jgi:glycosyltransferase involved in cell wall biosynthesis
MSRNSDAKSDVMGLDIIVANDFAHVNGGSAQVALSSALGLAERGHRVTFFAAVPPVADSLRSAGVNVVLTGQYDIKTDPNRFRAAIQGLWNPQSAERMECVLANAIPNRTILHVHGWTKALTSSIIRVAIQRGIPVVVTLHDYFYACPNGGFFNFQRQQSCPLRPLSAACIKENCDRDGYPEKVWRSVRQVIQNRFGFPSSRLLSFITISDFSENVLKSFLPPHATIFRVASPSDFAKELPVDVTRNTQFMCLGRLSPEKGLNLVAAAAHDLNCPVTFVGEGPSRDKIVSANPQAQITGWQPRENVKTYLRSARCLVLSSLWYEAQPMVVAEAAAVGVPAIVADQCAGREMVENGVTGFWFRSGDRADLRDKMRILQNPETAERLGRAAYDRHWNAPFTLEKHLVALERCYHSMLGAGLVQTEEVLPVL